MMAAIVGCGTLGSKPRSDCSLAVLADTYAGRRCPEAISFLCRSLCSLDHGSAMVAGVAREAAEATRGSAGLVSPVGFPLPFPNY